MKRREFLKEVGAVSLTTLTTAYSVPKVHAAASEWSLSKEDLAVSGLDVRAPVKRVTFQPKCHWHAYYDQVQFSPTGRFVIGNEVDFEFRSPKPNDRISVGIIDLEDKNKWIPIGSTVSWNWQLGCMLQFIPNRKNEVIWNDLKGNDYISYVYDIETGKSRDLPGPCYALSPDGKYTVYPDFRRLGDTRPGYGYCCVPDPNNDVNIPKNAGLWKMDLETGKREMLFSFADIAAIPEPDGFPENVKHWFNHLIVSPDCKRFLFLHRWQREAGKMAWFTRMCTANADGSDVYVVNHHPMTSHLFWRDPNHIVAYAFRPEHKNQVYLFEDKTQNAEIYSKNSCQWGDTHISYVPQTNNKWVLNDSYPNGKERLQTVFLYHVDTQEQIILGRFPSPKDYNGEWRTDLHPTCSRDGKKIMIDTCCFGGRQICIINIEQFIK